MGPSAAERLLRGAANKLTDANIAGRVGLDSLWIRDADRELEGRGLFNHLLEQATGPMGGVLKNVLVGTQQIGEGHTMRGVETMLPKGLKDMLKAGRYAMQGVNTLRGDPILRDVRTSACGMSCSRAPASAQPAWLSSTSARAR